MMPMHYRATSIPIFITRRLRGFMEFILACLVLVVLVGIAIPSYALYLERGYVAEALIDATVIKQELTAMRAETGRWPVGENLPILAKQENNRPVATAQYEEAAFTIVLNRKHVNHRVSFRAATSPSSPRSPVLWLCGYAAPPAGYQVIAPNRTDIPMAYLPNACRGTM